MIFERGSTGGGMRRSKDVVMGLIVSPSTIRALLLGMALLLFPSVTSAKTVSYTREYRYQASEADSKLSSRTIALEQVKRLLLEELGTYVISMTEVKDFAVTKDKIISFSAGTVSTIIIEEKWDGLAYYLKAKISADTDELVRAIDRVQKDQEQSMELEAMRKRTDDTLQEIEELKKEFGRGKGDKATQEKYAKSVDALTATDWYRKGYASRFVEYNLREAMDAFNKAIELDPNFGMAYAGRAAIYCEWEMYEKALRESERAVKLDPNISFNFTVLGRSKIALGKVEEGIGDLNRAIVLNPSNTLTYSNRSYGYFLLKKYDEAMADANKAIELGPKNSNPYFQKGRVLLALNEIKEAIKYFDKAIEYNPKVARFFFWRGKALMENSETERGLEDIRKAARMGNRAARGYLESKGK
jgi:tetratricopeptide (TPR) repeat protein